MGTMTSQGTRQDLGQELAQELLQEPSIELTSTPHEPPPSADLKFGRVFSDHMYQLDFDAGVGWRRPRVVPFAPLPLSPAAAGLHYAQAMFDGLKAFRGVDGKVRIFRIDRHCQRMSHGAERLCMPSIDPQVMRQALLDFVKVERRWVPTGSGTALYLRPTLLATEPFLGVRPANQYLFFIIASPVGPYYAEGFGPVKIRIEDKYVRAAPGGLGAVKAGANYVASLYAAERAKAAGFAQVLWTDAATHTLLEEVGTMNLVVRIGDEFATPALDGTILSGVTRDSVLTLLRRWGFEARERPISVDEILQAHKASRLTEVFGCGTGAVISPVGELGWKGETFRVGDGGAGPMSSRLFQAITDIQYGQAPDPDGWMTVVPE